MRRKLIVASSFAVLLIAIGYLFLHTSSLSAQALPQGAESLNAQVKAPPLIAQMLTLVGLALLPYIVMLLTSFTKMVVALSLLRNALGLQSSPPNQVLIGISLILTLYVMFPVGQAMYNKVEHLINEETPTELFSAGSADFIIQAASEAREPLRDFLVRNTRAKHIRNFYRLAYKYFPETVRDTLGAHDFIIIVPAFIVSQVEDAFQIGVLIYLPFFIVDLVTSNILLAMGMMMLSPVTISLPLKLLLLVMVDGWSLLVQGLVLSFN